MGTVHFKQELTSSVLTSCGFGCSNTSLVLGEVNEEILAKCVDKS